MTKFEKTEYKLLTAEEIKDIEQFEFINFRNKLKFEILTENNKQFVKVFE